MAKFRETMWFKMGDAREPESDGDETDPSATVTMMSLPIEDRYVGKPTAEESASYGLHTGRTEAIRVDKALAVVECDVAMTTLVGEMKRHSRTWIVGVVVGLAALVSAVAVYV